jgi:hypothetical protein
MAEQPHIAVTGGELVAAHVLHVGRRVGPVFLQGDQHRDLFHGALDVLAGRLAIPRGGAQEEGAYFGKGLGMVLGWGR